MPFVIGAHLSTSLLPRRTYAQPIRVVTGAFVKIGFFRSADDLVYHDEVQGDLLSQVRQTMDLLLTKYLKAAISYDGLQRVERFPVPRAALREAVLNAIVHRDYRVPAPVQIRVHDDKLSLWNPAALPEGWTAQTLLAPHASQPFNPDIANTFFRAGEIEAWGRGIERIFSACRQAASPKPKLRFDGSGVWLEFKFDPKFLRLMRTADAATDPVTDPVDQLVLLLAGDTLPPSTLQSRLGLKHRPTFRANYLRPALERTWIEMTLPDKPTIHLQQYRLTSVGHTRLLWLKTPSPPK